MRLDPFPPGTILTVGDVSVFQHRDRDEWQITVEKQPHPLLLTRRQVIELIHALGATEYLAESAWIQAIRDQKIFELDTKDE